MELAALRLLAETLVWNAQAGTADTQRRILSPMCCPTLSQAVAAAA